MIIRLKEELKFKIVIPRDPFTTDSTHWTALERNYIDHVKWNVYVFNMEPYKVKEVSYEISILIVLKQEKKLKGNVLQVKQYRSHRSFNCFGLSNDSD